MASRFSWCALGLLPSVALAQWRILSHIREGRKHYSNGSALLAPFSLEDCISALLEGSNREKQGKSRKEETDRAHLYDLDSAE